MKIRRQSKVASWDVRSFMCILFTIHCPTPIISLSHVIVGTTIALGLINVEIAQLLGQLLDAMLAWKIGPVDIPNSKNMLDLRTLTPFSLKSFLSHKTALECHFPKNPPRLFRKLSWIPVLNVLHQTDSTIQSDTLDQESHQHNHCNHRSTFYPGQKCDSLNPMTCRWAPNTKNRKRQFEDT